ncbi:hypothetical protein QUB63_18630 [Microcoleus sp. ARI1-B5]|uniref:hypothetical protein n=1 Tax=unclassified Microcoleus TaxID=2642155 RepID=UPI002FCEB91D
MIEEILAESPHLTPQQLVEALATEISESGRSQNFLDSIKIPAASNSETETSESVTDSDKMGDLGDRLNPQFLEHCRQELRYRCRVRRSLIVVNSQNCCCDAPYFN